MAGRALDIKEGGTGQTTAPGARLALGVYGLGDDVEFNDGIFTGNVSVTGTLSVDGIVTFNNDLNVTGDTVMTGSLSVGTTLVTSDLQVDNNANVNGTFTAGSATITTTLLAGSITATGNIESGGDVDVAGSLFIGNDLQVDDDATFNSALTITGLGSGLVAHTGSGAYAARTLTGPAAGITVSNGSGVSGNPTLALADDLAALESQSGTGMMARTASNTYAHRTITGTANKITVTDGSGVSGNPTLTIPDAVTLVTPTVTGTLDVSAGSLILPQGSAPTPTAEGSLAWDTDDNWLVVGDGANTRKLSNWEFVGLALPSNASSVDFTGLSVFRTLRFRLFLRPSTDAVFTVVHTSTNNGSSYDNSANNYHWQYVYATSDTTAAASTATTSSNMFLTSVASGNSANEGTYAEGTFYNFNQAEYGRMSTVFMNIDTSGVQRSGMVWNSRAQATARDAIRFVMTSGNIAEGYVILEGLRG